MVLVAQVLGDVRQIPDEDVTVAVETELLLDEGVPSHLIDVWTTDGVVTLSGQVDNLLARKRAVRVAETTKGVRAVVDRTEVSPTERDDGRIRSDVITALAMDPAADAYEIDVSVKDGVVTLTGSVNSWAERQLAEHMAMGVDGIVEIDNQIAVDEDVVRTDAEIQPEIERRLEVDALVDAGLIDVSVSGGEVTLSRFVGSAAEKTRARMDAWVAGVRSVDADGLKVKWWARDEMRRSTEYIWASDDEIKGAIEDAFIYDPRILSFRPEIKVEGGMVTLRGTVGSLSAKRAAEETARNTTGVWRVTNLIRVRPGDVPKDAVLAGRVREALERNPFITSTDMNVTARNGRVYLRGSADSRFEKDQAGEVAAGVRGVIKVENLLRLPPWTWKDDWEILQDVEARLWWNPFIDEEAIMVTVEDGVVTLSGTVDNWYERNLATAKALNAGAARVRNRIRVRQKSPEGSPAGVSR
jgi:osmotically-inducible protein OsmY